MKPYATNISHHSIHPIQVIQPNHPYIPTQPLYHHQQQLENNHHGQNRPSNWLQQRRPRRHNGQSLRLQGVPRLATLRNKSKTGDLTEIDGIEIVELEVTSTESIRQCADSIAKRTGGSLDILVNNAGVNSVTPLLDADLAEAKRVYDTNVWGALAMAQEFAPLLIQAKGTMCNISSVSGEMVFAWAGIYSSSKCAEIRISETLRLEMAPLGVKVVTVILGGVQTSGNTAANIPDLELPENSYYRKITAAIDRHKKVLVHPNKQDVEVAAKNVVEDVLSSNKYFIRRGNASSLSWICNTFLPYRLFTWMINQESALSDIGYL